MCNSASATRHDRVLKRNTNNSWDGSKTKSSDKVKKSDKTEKSDKSEKPAKKKRWRLDPVLADIQEAKKLGTGKAVKKDSNSAKEVNHLILVQTNMSRKEDRVLQKQTRM